MIARSAASSRELSQPGAAATLPPRDYEATRQRLYSDFITRPLPEPIEYKPIRYPATSGSYTAQGSIVVNYDVLREMQMSSELKAVETPMFKVGDRVKILRAMTAEEKDKTPHGWMSGMQQFVGTVGVVSGINDYGAQIKHASGIIYSWPLSFLELAPAAVSAMPAAQDHPFPSKEEAAAVNRDAWKKGDDHPVWRVGSPSGDCSFVTCLAGLEQVDTYPTFKAEKSEKTGRWSDFKDYTARLLNKDGKPTERKHIALTTGAAAPQLDITVNGKTATFPATATAAQAVAVMQAAGIDNVSVGGAAAPSSPMPPSTREKIADALRRHAAAKTHSDVFAAKTGQRDVNARAAERLKQAVTKEHWRDFPSEDEVRAAPFTVWAIQRPDGSVFYGYFVVAEEYIYLQQCTDKGISLEGAFSEPFSVLHDLKARPIIEEQTDIKCNTLVRIAAVQSDLDTLDRGTVIETTRSTVGGPLCTVRSDDRKKTVTVPLRRLTFEYKNFAAKIAAQVERKAAEAAEAANNPVFTISQTSNGWKITDVAYTTAHDVAEARGTSDRPLGEVLTPLQTEVKPGSVTDPSVKDITLTYDFEVDSQGESPLKHESFGAQLAAMSHRLAAEAAAKEALTSATTSATIPKQGATMPPSDTAKPSRLRRAITEATRRAPVELGLNQAHAAIVKQAARKFKGTRAEKAVVARFLSDLLGSEYGKAGLAAALATVIPQLAPLLGKHEGKAETLAEELATRSATILAVKAGSDLISLLGPLTAILSDMISSAETPQITAGTGRSALDEIGDVATVRSV